MKKFLFLLIIVVFFVGGWSRNRLWIDEKDLWIDCLERSPKKRRPYNNLGLSYYRNGNLAEAEKAYRKALSIDPTYLIAKNGLGVVLLESGRVNEAIASFEDILRYKPTNSEVRGNLSFALYYKG